MNGWKYILVEMPPSLEIIGIAFPPFISHADFAKRVMCPVVGAGFLRMENENDGTFWRWKTSGKSESLQFVSHPNDADFFNK